MLEGGFLPQNLSKINVRYNRIMIEIDIPGKDILQLEHLVCDVNGTLAVDGVLFSGVVDALDNLRSQMNIHLLTADTHGQQNVIDQQLNLRAVRLERGGEAEQKAAYVRQLGGKRTAALGQGANDAGMLREAALGICVLSTEGVATETLLASDIVLPDTLSGLELLQKPIRVVASLRK